MLQGLIFALLLSVVIPLPAWAVSVASYASRDDVSVGESFSVNVVVVNTRATAITDFRVSVQRPAETGSVINVADATCNPGNCPVGAQISWTQPSLGPGEVFTATFKTTLNTQANTAGTVVTFPIAISGGGVSISNSSLQVKSAGPNATATSQRLRLSSSSPVLAPGEEAVVTATFGNTHISNISFGNILTVTLPTGLELVRVIDGSTSGQQAQWNIGPISPATSLQRLLIVRASATGGALAMQATLQSSEQSSTARHVVAVQTAPKLRVFVEPERTWGGNGSAAPVRIRVENHGVATSSAVTLRARLPAGSGGSTAPSDTPTNCPELCGALNEIVWNVGNLPSGASRSYTYRDLLHSNNSGDAAVGGSLRLEALVISEASRVIATADIAIGTAGRLDLHVNPAMPSFPIGQSVPVEIAVGNWWASTVSLGTELELRLPSGMEVLEADGGTLTAEGLAWSLGAIDPGQGRVRHIVVRARSDGPWPPWDRIFRNGFESGPGQSSPGPLLARVRNSSGDATHTTWHHGSYITRANTLQMSVSMTPNPVQRYGFFTGAITVTNTDIVDRVGTHVYLRLPEGIYSAWYLSDDGVGSCSICAAGRILSWNVGPLAAGASRTFTLTMQLSSQATPGLLLSYQAWARANNGLDRSEAMDLVLVRSAPDLLLAAETNRDAVQPEGSLTYTLAYSNRSTSATSIATLRLPLPEGTSFLSATGDGVLIENTVVWPLGAIPPGKNGVRQAKLSVADRPEGSLLETTATLADTANNVAYADVVNRIETGAALHLAVAMNPNPVMLHEHFNGEITVTNTDAVDLFGTHVYLRLPPGIFLARYLSDDGTGSCTNCLQGQILTWNLGQLPAGASRTLTLSMQASTLDVVPGYMLSFDAWARANNGLDRAAASDTIFVHSSPTQRLAVKTDRDAVHPGGTLTYTLVYGNPLITTSSAATLRLPLPEGTSFVSATGGGVLSGDEVIWSLEAIAAGQTGVRQVTLAVADRPEGSLLKTTATLTDTANNVAYADVVNHIHTGAALHLTVAMSPNPVAPSGHVNGVITVANTDTVDLFGTNVYLRLPAGTSTALNLSDGGTGSCTSCWEGWFLTWNLGQLPAGASRTLTLDIQLRSSQQLPPGDALSYEAWARASNGLDHAKSRELLRVHP